MTGALLHRPWTIRALRWGVPLYAVALFIGTHLPPRVAHDWSGGLAATSDKVLHFSAYAVLAALLALVWGTVRPLAIKHYAIVWLLVAALGAIDEWTQSLPGVNRTTDLYDWCADILGAICGLAVAALIRRFLG